MYVPLISDTKHCVYPGIQQICMRECMHVDMCVCMSLHFWDTTGGTYFRECKKYVRMYAFRHVCMTSD
jgi:hypothetical protein